MINVQVALKEEAAATSASPEKRRRHFEIVVFNRWCKGCGLCSTFCPTQAILSDEEGRPKSTLPDRCTGCQWCVMHCPDLAIKIRAQNPGED